MLNASAFNSLWNMRPRGGITTWRSRLAIWWNSSNFSNQRFEWWRVLLIQDFLNHVLFELAFHPLYFLNHVLFRFFLFVLVSEISFIASYHRLWFCVFREWPCGAQGWKAHRESGIDDNKKINVIIYAYPFVITELSFFCFFSELENIYRRR